MQNAESAEKTSSIGRIVQDELHCDKHLTFRYINPMPPPTDKDFRLMAKVAQISQIGMEMAVPVGIGVGLDFWLKTMPWFTIIGAILGPTLGFIHLLSLIKPQNKNETESKP